MLSELNIDEIKKLIEIKSENKNLDYKEFLNWLTATTDEKLDLIKDILAMANTQDGGKLVFGVKDNDFNFVGLSNSDFDSLDTTKINDFLHKYADPTFSCIVYKHEIDSKLTIVIDVPEFKDTPIICKADAHSSKKPNQLILKKGQMYIRTDKGTSQSISAAEEMRELLTRAVQKREMNFFLISKSFSRELPVPQLKKIKINLI